MRLHIEARESGRNTGKSLCGRELPDGFDPWTHQGEPCERCMKIEDDSETRQDSELQKHMGRAEIWRKRVQDDEHRQLMALARLVISPGRMLEVESVGMVVRAVSGNLSWSGSESVWREALRKALEER